MAESPLLDQSAQPYFNNETFSLGSALLHLSSGHGLDKQQWNALIGIVTAIVGNVLISFALNLQRYAHIRLNRAEKALQNSGKLGASNGEGYAPQTKASKKQSKLGVEAPAPKHTAGKEPDERTSLINGKQRQESNESDDTVRPAPLEMDDGRDAEEEDGRKTTYLKSPWWWAGIILMIIGEAGNFLAYGFAPASLVSPLGVVALISNCIIAPWLLKEKFRKRDGLGVFIAVGGVVTLVLSSTGQEKRMGPDDIWKEITRWEFELYLGLTLGAMLVLVWASDRYGDRTLLIDLGLVGLFGGYTALATKGIASLLSDTLWKAVTFPITYLLAVILIGTALLQIRYLNRALSRFDSTQVIPTQFVMFTISVIVGSAVLFRDFESADAERFSKFIGGCALTFLGVYLITSGRQNDDDLPEEDEEEDEEENIGLLVEDEAAGTERVVTPSGSRRTSLQPPPKTGTLERMVSDVSQQSQPFTPSSLGPDSPFGENPWADSPREEPHRHPSNFTSSSVITDVSDLQPRSTSNTPVRRNFLTTTPGKHSKHRRSIADIFTGPISTPLSSSLSGVIADRRRELEASSSKLRRSLGLRRSKSSRFRNAENGDHSNDSPLGNPSEDVSVNNSDELAGDDTPSKHSRSRSLSLGDSLGLLFKSNLRKKSKPGNGPQAEP